MIDMEKFPELKSLNRFIITFFFVLGVTFSMVAPFSIVNAEGVTYVTIPANTKVLTGKRGDGSASGYEFYYEFTEDVRVLYFKKHDNGDYRPFFAAVSDKSLSYIKWEYHNGNYSRAAWGDTNINSDGYSVTTTLVSTYNGYSKNDDLPYIDEVYSREQAIYYTFGDGAVGEEDLITYGSIEDLSYSTNIVGSGTTTGDANIDTISWFPYWDTNSNISTTWNMEIQVVPGTWQGGTNTDIFSQSYQDFIINESGAMSIYHGTYLNGSYSISWGEVKNKLSILTWADLFQYFDGTYWNKKGWVYRARFNDPDNDYWSDWQTVYTVTSSAGEGVENYIDPSDGTGLPDFYNNAVDSYNTTSIVNNNNSITYYYVNTPVDTNPSSDDSTQYLKEIRDTIIQIRRMIAVDHNADAIPDNDNDPWSGNPAAELYDFEDNSINDFNDAVSDLPTSDLVTGNKFLAASTWVRTQYEALVSNTPIEAVIIFSLLLGFGLLLIGKLR